ncbi:unnamed protein product, partial [Dibothriocephalus latus]
MSYDYLLPQDKSNAAQVIEENYIGGQTRSVNTPKTANAFAKQFLMEAHEHLQRVLTDDLEPSDLKQTLAYAEKCIRFAPSNPTFYIFKGELYAKRGDLSSAIQVFRKAMTCISHCSNYEIEVKIVTESGAEVITTENIERRFMDLTFVHGQEQIKAGQFEEGLNSLRAAMFIAEYVQQEQHRAYALTQDPDHPAAKQLLMKLQTYGQRLCSRSHWFSAIGRPED